MGAKREKVEEELSLTEEQDLVGRAQQGDEEAQTELALYLASVVNFFAWQRMRTGACTFYPFEDFKQDGYVGMLESLRSYQKEKGRFKTFASFRIRGEMFDSLRHRGLARESRTLRSMWTEAEEIRNQLSHKLLREPTITEWKNTLPPHIKKVFEELRVQMNQNFLSLDHRSDNDTEDGCFTDPLEEIVPLQGLWSDGVTEIEKREREEILKVFRGIYSRLKDPRKRCILELRYGVLDGEGRNPLTQREVAEILEVDDTRICQIEKDILRDLLEKLRAYPADFLALRDLAASL